MLIIARANRARLYGLTLHADTKQTKHPAVSYSPNVESPISVPTEAGPQMRRVVIKPNPVLRQVGSLMKRFIHSMPRSDPGPREANLSWSTKCKTKFSLTECLIALWFLLSLSLYCWSFLYIYTPPTWYYFVLLNLLDLLIMVGPMVEAHGSNPIVV